MLNGGAHPPDGISLEATPKYRIIAGYLHSYGEKSENGKRLKKGIKTINQEDKHHDKD